MYIVSPVAGPGNHQATIWAPSLYGPACIDVSLWCPLQMLSDAPHLVGTELTLECQSDGETNITFCCSLHRLNKVWLEEATVGTSRSTWGISSLVST